MTDATPAYGLWSLVIVNSAVFIFFAYTFFKPQTPRPNATPNLWDR